MTEGRNIGTKTIIFCFLDNISVALVLDGTDTVERLSSSMTNYVFTIYIVVCLVRALSIIPLVGFLAYSFWVSQI